MKNEQIFSFDKLYMVLVALLLTLCVAFRMAHSEENSVHSNPTPASVSSQRRHLRIWIDPGHGGRDLGAQGLYGISEKDLCLRISKMIRRELEHYQNMKDLPIDIQLSREEDAYISLKDRVGSANNWGADLFVSIHANSSPYTRAHGFEVYFLNAEATDEEANKLARLENAAPPTPIQADVLSILSDVQTNSHIVNSSRFAEEMFSAISRKAISTGRGVRQAPFAVLHGTQMPAVLIEVGYVTNRMEAKNLTRDHYLKGLANAISSGIVEFAAQKDALTWQFSRS